MLLHEIKGLEEFESDDLYKQFMTDNFDVKAITSSAVQCAAVAEHLAKLSAGISLLDKALHHQVSSHYEDLLSQATEIETFEEVLVNVHQQIRNLLSSADKLKAKVVQPYETIATLTRKLHRLHVVCDLLRKIIRVVRISRRLKNHLSKEPPEISKAANCLSELEDLDSLEDLLVVEAEMKYIKHAKSIVQNENKGS
ncbi:conserved oligomeric Golgi complex subunit 5 [Trichonephila inaurata madagascariensis]|uniref:Conserved oligomeric Golgi complex subunit 5 n=1 Tax=Trichonephila inaurata madagascariensis TaxID=2747483 RepID=A0A8X6XJF5_9ARAC|nr:conserved oligomeric Golgi complex subunit 5 [Trichonephila inaurata madagascariensis]